MTVQSEVSRADYTGNGATTTFPVPFYFLLDTDIRVVLQDNSVNPPTERDLIYPFEYLVHGAGDEAGGSITLIPALLFAVPTAQQKITILRDVPFTQLREYVPNDPFPAASHEMALDKLTMEIQELAEQVVRTVRLPPTVIGVNTELPVPIANNLLGWDSSATALVDVDPSTLAGSGGGSGPIFVDGETPSGAVNNVNKDFTLAYTPSIGSLKLYVNGVRQKPGDDFTLAVSTITMTVAPQINGLTPDWLTADYRR
jgi:hypothetical protein